MNNVSLQRSAWLTVGLLGMFVLGMSVSKYTHDTSDYQATIVSDDFVLGYVFTQATPWDLFRVGETIDRGDVVFSTYDASTQTGTGIWNGRVMDYEILGERTRVWRYSGAGNRPGRHTFELEYDDETEVINVYRRQRPSRLHRELKTQGRVVYPDARTSAEIATEVYRGSVPNCSMNGVCDNGFGVQLEPEWGVSFHDAMMQRHSQNQYYQRMWFWNDYIFDGFVDNRDIQNF